MYLAVFLLGVTSAGHARSVHGLHELADVIPICLELPGIKLASWIAIAGIQADARPFIRWNVVHSLLYLKDVDALCGALSRRLPNNQKHIWEIKSI